MYLSVTNSFLNRGPKYSSDKFNQNFTDIINGLSDGSKDFNIANLTTRSTMTSKNLKVSGAVTIDSQITSNKLNLQSTSSTLLNTKKLALDPSSILINAINITPTSSHSNINATLYNANTFDSIEVVTGVNDSIDFMEFATELTATISSGTYLPSVLAIEIETRLNAIGSFLYFCTYANSAFTIRTFENKYFDLLFRTGTNFNTTIAASIGFDITYNYTGSYTYTSDYQYQIGYYRTFNTISSTNLEDGDLIILSVTNPITTPYLTMINTTGNIKCGSNKIFTQNSNAILIYSSTSAKFHLISFSTN